MRPHQLLARLRSGAVGNVRFSDMRRLLEALGFELNRTRGDHHIFVHRRVSEVINLQEVGGQAKPYQIRQLLRLIERYALELEGKR
jgi:predicted RNA binding protein YcfA (HicA-like mRNA interferase family)